MALTKRVQVLMEPQEFQQLEAIAAQQGRAVGDLVRAAARERYLTGEAQRIQAMEQFLHHRLTTASGSEATTLTAARRPQIPGNPP